jgi:hypothetical protein
LEPFDAKLKLLTSSATTITTAKKLAQDLSKQIAAIKELKGVLKTMVTSQVAKAYRIHHTLDLPDKHKNDPELIKLVKEVDEYAQKYEMEQMEWMIQSKKHILELKQAGQRETLL